MEVVVKEGLIVGIEGTFLVLVQVAAHEFKFFQCTREGVIIEYNRWDDAVYQRGAVISSVDGEEIVEVVEFGRVYSLI